MELVHFCRVNGPASLYRTIVAYEGDHWLIDNKGNQYLDTMSGCRTTILGYDCRPIKEAMASQLETMPFYPTVFHSHSDVGLEAAETVAGILPAHRSVFFTPTGSLANETAIKFATKYWADRSHPRKCAIAYMSRSYHGTTGLIGCTSDQPMNASMNLALAMPSHCIGITVKDEQIDGQATLDAIEAAFREHGSGIAALILDAVTTSALYTYPDWFWRALREVCDRYEVLMILDEVVTGFGKTGWMTASEKWGIDADIVTLGKGMANGYFPFAATCCKPHVTERLDWLLHGMTFSSHPVGAVAFMRNVELLAGRLPEIRARYTASDGIHTRNAHNLRNPKLRGVRVVGCLGGLTMERGCNVRLIEEEGWRRGIVVYAGGGPSSTKLTWCLPITLADREVGDFFSTLQSIMDHLFRD